ncbi:helix-turn-helix domain-containing protein [Bradyrhizobium denitrificans]|uniref:helix-turn-helix domain-containing protein n=1 Tax=Bradyrhizobium denitrificans TaxID=2734912 RepID=UPI001552FEA8|nr:hypothetical protein [Bradyrhizobium sp. LMG 8443]NPU23972.1 hypothetical protein [Bradyrhizobium sp. LMG 8443]
MTGEEFHGARATFSAASGRKLSQADMAKLVGLSDPGGNGADTVRKWEKGDGPSGPVATLVSLAIDGLTSQKRDIEAFIIEWILDGTD